MPGNTAVSARFIRHLRSILLVLVLSAATPLEASNLRHLVPDADLAQVAPESLQSLGALEQALVEARVASERAAQEVTTAKAAIAPAQNVVKGQEANVDAAKAELKAAKVNKDDARIEKAEDAVDAQKRTLKEAKKRLFAADEVRRAREGAADAAKLLIEVRMAERELARAKLLSEQKVASAEKHPVDTYTKQLAKREKRYKKALKRAAKLQKQADRATSKLPPAPAAEEAKPPEPSKQEASPKKD